MKLTVLPESQAWFQEELGVTAGDAVRFYGKYGGSTNVHTGFSTGMEVTKPENPIVTIEENGITYFVEKMDDWFFNGYDLIVDFDPHLKEPCYIYQESVANKE